MLVAAPCEPPTHEELDRQRRFLEAERIAFEWYKLRRSRLDFEAEASTAMYLLDLARCDQVGTRNLWALDASDMMHAPGATDMLCVSANEANLDSHHDPIIGRRVCKYWEGSKRYFAGTVAASKFQKGVKLYFVAYDDGDEAWESEVEDIDDAALPICRRTLTCWKRANHSGKCLGAKCPKKRKTLTRVAGDSICATFVTEEDAATTHECRVRKAPNRLGNDIGWASLQSRRWHSACA